MKSASLGSLLVGLLLLSVVFGVLERAFPARAAQSIWQRGRLTDFAYWFFTPLVTRTATRAAAALAIVLASLVAGGSTDAAALLAEIRLSSAIARQPAALQLIEALLLADLLSYWMHRLFHGRALWRFHAVHHSSTSLDWLAATRLHPVNDVASRVATAVPLLLLGFDLGVFAAVAPILGLYAIFLHANVSWDFGPLRYVIATPAFHRWHHAADVEAVDRNFAGLFPVLDLIFGTFHMPRGRQPERFGVSDPVPAGLIGQLAFPFRRAARAAPPSP